MTSNATNGLVLSDELIEMAQRLASELANLHGSAFPDLTPKQQMIVLQQSISLYPALLSAYAAVCAIADFAAQGGESETSSTSP